MTIESGRYTITNAKYKNSAFLHDANHDSPLLTSHRRVISGEEWEVMHLRNGSYSVKNFGHQMFAGATYHSKEDDHVIGSENQSEWLIERSSIDKGYTIMTLNRRLAWWLDDMQPKTPITLHTPQPSDTRCQWTFKRIRLEHEEDLAGARLEAAEKKIQQEVAAREKAQEREREARELAKEAVKQREEAEERARQAAKLAEDEMSKRLSAEAKELQATNRAKEETGAAEERAQQAIKFAEEEIAKRIAAEERELRATKLAKEEKERTQQMIEADAARGRATEEKELLAAKRVKEKLEAAEERAERAVNSAQEEATKTRVAKERELQATKLAKEEVERRKIVEKQAQQAINLTQDETTRRKMAEEVAEKAIILFQNEVIPKRKAADEGVLRIRSSAQDSLFHLASVAPYKELAAIANGASTAIEIIEPWCGATTNHPQLQQVVQKIRGHSIVFLKAIDISIKTSEDGFAFSCDAIELCEYLLDPGTDLGDLQEYILDMQTKARQAHNDSIAALNMFRDVWSGLFEILKKIPKEATAGAGQKVSFIRPLSRVVGETKDANFYAAIMGLNLAALVTRTKLADDISKFAAWWGEIDTAFGKAERSSSSLRPGKDRLRVIDMKKTWTGIREDYRQYKVQMSQLQLAER